ncbi:dsrE/DsrF-like family protein, partial [Vibrio cholerae CP1030(3)]|jgi:fructose-bisphosphate aldolase class II
MKP